MTMHLFGAVLTGIGISSNNRGETEGNTTTLQKILWQGDVHSTVSAEAIRFALRARWQARGLSLNRRWDEDTRTNTWHDQKFAGGAGQFVDDDVLGYMAAEAARQSGERGAARVRRSRFEVTRALSLDAWPGDVTFSVASIGATPSASRGGGGTPVPYSAEVHATRYQFGFALTPDALERRERAADVVTAIAELGTVAGNHARFLYDFSPESIILRITEDPAPRILYPFVSGGGDAVGVPAIVRRVEGGDLQATELILGGPIAVSSDGARLGEAGAALYGGVRDAADRAVRRLGVG